MSQPKRETGKSFQVPVRLPKPLYDELRRRPGSVAGQIVALVREGLERENSNDENSSKGYMFHNPDTGWEWSYNHPVLSGECDDATQIVAMTKMEFERLERLRIWGEGGYSAEAQAELRRIREQGER